MNLIMFIVGLVLTLLSLGLLMYFVIKFVKTGKLNNQTPKIEKKDFICFLSLIILMGLFTILSNYGLVLKEGFLLQIGEHFLMTIGSLLFGSGIGLLVSTFILYYYRPDLEKKQRKIARILTFVSIPVIIAGIWMFSDAFAPYLSYPLVNGVSIPGGFTRPNMGNGGFAIKWYGIIIVAGAGVSYFVSDHYFYKEYKKHGILDTLLLVAFPMGIIGARLWYVIVLEPGTNFFAFQNGGLAIQGGALLGIISGVIFMMIFRRYVNVRWAMDIIVPTVLIAQAIGRWGNFFNHEVYGLVTDTSSWWFLPKIIVNNMYVSTSDPTKMYVPLFFVEFCTNLIGYFVIRYAIGKPLKKILSNGDLSMTYLIWYGLTRIFLEPLRFGYTPDEHTEGFGYNQSYVTAYVFVIIGVLGIIAFHLYDYFRTLYKEHPSYFIFKKFKKEDRQNIKNLYSALLEKEDLKSLSREQKKAVEAICLYKAISNFHADKLDEYMKDYFSNYYNMHQNYYDNKYGKFHKKSSDIKSFSKKIAKKPEFGTIHEVDFKTYCEVNNFYKEYALRYDTKEIIPYFEEALVNKYKIRDYMSIEFKDDNISFVFCQ